MLSEFQVFSCRQVHETEPGKKMQVVGGGVSPAGVREQDTWTEAFNSGMKVHE